jgi:TolB protein
VALTGFERWGDWRRGNEAWGTFTQSAEQSTAGQYAGKFIYDFPTVDNNYVVFRQSINISMHPDALRIQVYGDGATHFLNAWVQDANNQLWQFTFGRINHTGWQTMWAPLDLSLGWPNQAIGNTRATELAYPVRLAALVLDGHTSEQAFQGVIYVDDLEAVTFADSPNYSVSNPAALASGDAGGGNSSGTVAVVTASNLNVRSGPGTGYGVVGKVTQGQSLPVIEQDAASGWVQIELPSTTGWVSGNHVRIEGTVTAISQPTSTTPNTTSTNTQTEVQSAPATSATQQSSAVSSGPLLGRIAFPSFTDGAYAIYVVNADGTNLQRVLGNASQPALSPNGQQLAFRYWKHDERSIAVMNTYGGDLRRITNFVEDALPAWSPNGQTLVFTSRRESDRRSRLYQANVSGRNDWEIKRDGDTIRSEYAVWMPDGRILYRATRPQISLSIMNNDGGNPILIVPDGDATAPAIAPNGHVILFMSRRDGNWEIYLTDLGGNMLTRLTNHPGNDGLPVWSPDGQSIAFASDRSGYWAIWVMNADGSGQRELVAIPGSLDGRVTNEPDYSSRGWTEERISWSR